MRGLFMLLVLLPTSLWSDEPWREYLRQRTIEVETASQAALKEITPARWPETQAQWRSQLQEMLGLAPWPERNELSVTITGQLERDQYQVTNLHYQSRPGLYVAANLYQPKGQPPAGGWPAVLYVCGHANVRDEGRLLGNKTGYHHHGCWFAKQGVVCLIIDTIQLGEMHGEHHGTYKLGRWDWITRGYTPAGVEAWNAIRAVDYLQSLPQVNKERIGITGRSGGGAYSWYAAALDPRISVAVPVAGITDLRNHIVDNCVEGHCDCMYFVNYHGWDYNRLAALIAPRPLMLANSDHDTIFPLDGVLRIHHDVADLYAKLGVPNKFGLLLTPGPHLDTQELQVGAFRWLLTHLTDQPVSVDRAALKEIEPTDLQVFKRETPTDQHVADLSTWFVTAQTQSVSEQNELKAFARWREQLRIEPSPEQQYELVRQANVGQLTYRWYKQQSTAAKDSWLSQILVLHGQGVATDNVQVEIHIGALNQVAIDATAIDRELKPQGRLTQLVDKAPDALHVVLLPRSQQLWSADLSVHEKTHLERRFYLLGQSTEQLALSDMLGQLKWLQALTVQATADGLRLNSTPAWSLIGHGRHGPLAIVAGLQLNDQPEQSLRLKQLILIDYPSDWRLAAVLPGLARSTSLTDLLTSARRAFTLQEIHSRSPSEMCEGYDSLHQLLIDTAQWPQQATGLRLVEPRADGVTLWCRATRWMLPNLGDQAVVEFTDDSAVKLNQRREASLPADGTAGLRYAAPGVPAQLRVRYRSAGKGSWQETNWIDVNAQTDFSHLFAISELQPNTDYEVQCQARAPGNTEVSSTLTGNFRTLPAADGRRSLRVAIGTCQEFEDRDGEHGMDLYRTLVHRKTELFILAGDVVYYDRLARSLPLAYYHWQRTYSLPTHVNFHRRVPTLFLKDDHDTYVNDSWPGQYFQWTRQFTFEDGQRIFRQQTGLPEIPYRTLSLGRDLQLWLMEGRDYRNANDQADGPDKSIWGAAQTKWLEDTLAQSSATFKVIVSPTPIVGPDRAGKADNHANRSFATEGKRIRKLLSGYKNLVVVCGDRHWQYHSRDPDRGLNEFSVGPVTNRHAGGWDAQDYRQDIHQFLRVGGGYLELELNCDAATPALTFTLRDPYGQELHVHRSE